MQDCKYKNLQNCFKYDINFQDICGLIFISYKETLDNNNRNIIDWNKVNKQTVDVLYDNHSNIYTLTKAQSENKYIGYLRCIPFPFSQELCNEIMEKRMEQLQANIEQQEN